MKWGRYEKGFFTVLPGFRVLLCTFFTKISI